MDGIETEAAPQLLALARLGRGCLTGQAHRDIQRKWAIRGDVCGTCGRRRRSPAGMEISCPSGGNSVSACVDSALSVLTAGCGCSLPCWRRLPPSSARRPLYIRPPRPAGGVHAGRSSGDPGGQWHTRPTRCPGYWDGSVAVRRSAMAFSGGQALHRRRDPVAHLLRSECHLLVIGHDLAEISADTPGGRQVDGVK